MEQTIILGLIIMYLGGVMIAYREFEKMNGYEKFNKIGVSIKDESFVIVLSMFSWIMVIILYIDKLIRKNGINNDDMEF